MQNGSAEHITDPRATCDGVQTDQTDVDLWLPLDACREAVEQLITIIRKFRYRDQAGWLGVKAYGRCTPDLRAFAHHTDLEWNSRWITNAKGR